MKYTLHLKILEQLSYFLLIVLLPSQLGYHFWPDASLLFGFRIDYLSPTLYLTDLIILCNAALFLARHHQTIIPKTKATIHNLPTSIKICILFFICLFGIQLFVTPRPLLSIISLLTIIKLSYLSIYTAAARPLHKTQIFIGICLGLSWTYFLTVLQWFNHGALQGPWYWLGERAYQLHQPGIPASRVCLNSNDCFTSLRPMATFAHPNSLAGYFLIAGLLAFATIPPKLPYSKAIRTLILLGVITVLALTASQAVWLASIIAVMSFLIPKQWYKPTIWFSLIIYVITPVLLSHLTYTALDLTTRQRYQSAALQLIAQHPVLGLGLNQYLPALQTLTDYPIRLSTLQPVHHVGLLLTAYIGIPCALYLFYVVTKYLPHQIINSHFISANFALAIFIAILVTASFDHYWLTLHQNQLLLALTIGLCMTSKKQT